MSEAEILVIRSGLTGLVISVVSVAFGMISAYIAGLWLFLKSAPISLRFAAFLLLSGGLLFLGITAWGLDALLKGTDRAWEKLMATSSEIPDFGGEQTMPLTLPIVGETTLYEVAAILGFAAFFALYLGLAYLTFFFRWGAAPASLHRPRA
ncbi:MAG: hypothetical protein AAFV96_04835 [Pseudomonadota bacterium]